MCTKMCSQTVTDQNLTGIKRYLKEATTSKKYLIKYLQCGRWQLAQEPLERPLVAGPVSIGLIHHKSDTIITLLISASGIIHYFHKVHITFNNLCERSSH